MNVTKTYKLSSETQHISIMALWFYRDSVQENMSQCVTVNDLEGAEYWGDRLASIEAGISEIRAAA